MGKTARWFRGLWAGKKTEVSTDSKPPKEKEKWRWGIVRSSRDKDHPARSHGARNGSYREGSSASYGDAAIDQDKHAKAVAAATAAVAEAAVAAAQAAAAVVKLTSSGRCDSAYIREKQEECAAVKMQSAFRGYLARRALKALKGLVKLQALVRGHMVRKQMAADLRWLQALVRVQARARAACGHVSERRHPGKAIHLHPGPETPEKHERPRHTTTIKCDNPPTLKRNITKRNGIDINNVYKAHMGRNWLDQWVDEKSWDHQEALAKEGIADDEKNDKILEIDPGKPHFNPKRRSSNVHSLHSSNLNSQSHATLPDSPSKDSTTAQLSISSPSSVEMQSLSPLRFPLEVDDLPFCTEDNSPKFFSASLRPGNTKSGPFTPTKSDCSQSFLSGYSDYPNYMTNTESSRAKVRSQSAPKQRHEFEKSSSTKRFSVHGLGDARANTGVPKLSQRSSSLHAKFTSKAYPGTGRLDGLGMSVHEVMGCNGTYRNRY